MELKIDNEFRDLIPPLTEEEYKGLEESLLTDGFDRTMPIILWKGHDIIVDGHNRYGICQKHGIEFETVEREFESRYDVIKWMLDIQLNRRSPNKKKRTYVIGRRYLVEKNNAGNPNGFSQINQSGKNYHIGKTAEIIANQLSLTEKTVRNAAEFTSAVDKIVSVTGCKVNDLLDDKIRGTIEEIKNLATEEISLMRRIIELAITDNTNLHLSKINAEKELYDKRFQDIEEQKRQLKIKRDREEAEKLEKLRIEKEEREKQEEERAAKEKAAQEAKLEQEVKLKLEQEKLVEEEKEEEDEEELDTVDLEQIQKEHEEKLRIEKEKLAEQLRKLQEMRQKKIDGEERARKQREEERIKREKKEQEKRDLELIEKTIKETIKETPYDPYIQNAYEIMGDISLNACENAEVLYRINTEVKLQDKGTLDKSWYGKVWLDLLNADKESKLYIGKLLESCTEGRVTEAFVIARNDTSAEWFKHIFQKANAIVFPTKGSLKSHVLIYIGNNSEIFMNECEKYGCGVIIKK